MGHQEEHHKKHGALPSLLQHLRTPSSASISLDPAAASSASLPSPRRASRQRIPSNAPSTLSRSSVAAADDDAASLVPSPPPSHSPPIYERREETLSATQATQYGREGMRDSHGLADESAALARGTRSRSSSDASSSSSLEGLAARFQTARDGRGRGLVLPDEQDGTEKGTGKERSFQRERENAPGPAFFASDRHSRESSSALSVASSLQSSSSPAVEGSSFHRAEDSFDTDDVDDEDESFELPSRFEGQPDPREMLRAQLANSATGAAGKGEMTEEGQTSRRTSPTAESSRAAEKSEKGVLERYQPRRYFILSTAGKLVWTSDPDEEQAAGLVGVMQAIVSIFADEGDKIRYVHAGSTRIAFLLKPPLYLVVVSNGWGEPESVLRSHLEHLHLQLLSVVTLSQLQALFARRSNADLRQVISGTETFFVSLTASLQSSALALSVLTNSIEVYRVDARVREECAKALELGKEVVRDLDLLYVLILSHGRLVTLRRPKKHSIHPTDLHLLLSTIFCTSASAPPASASPSPASLEPLIDTKKPRRAPLTEPGAESWFPICLPRFNPRGFLYAYVSFFDAPSSAAHAPTESHIDGTGVVILSSRREAFEGVKDAASKVKERLLAGGTLSAGGEGWLGAAGAGKSKRTRIKTADGGLVHELEKQRVGQEFSLGELAIPGLRHFVYKSRALVQVIRPAWEGEYREEGSDGRCRLITLYQTVHEALHPRPVAAGSAAKPPAQVQYVRTEHEAVLGWITPSFELYACTSPLLPHSAVVYAARAVSKWVQKEETRLFLLNAPSF
ncbi:hypothetical protein JCM10213_000582 [Rhodosporidiobolus nylandii]